MPQIGTHIPESWQGEIPRPRRSGELIQRPGVNGHGALFDAWRRGAVEITTHVRYLTQAAAEAEADRQVAAVGTAVAVTDPLGRQFPGTVVLDCVPRVTLMPGSRALLTVQWLLLPPTTVPAGALP